MPFYTEWTQLDTIRTREPHRLRTGVNSNVVHRHGLVADLHSGEIEYDPHYLDEVFHPALATTMGFDGPADDVEQRASFVHNQRWLTTPIDRPPDPEEYDALFHASGSAVGVHDFDPHVTKLVELSDEITAAFEADPPPGLAFWFIEWETNPFATTPGGGGFAKWGTYANRVVEIDLALLLNSAADRAGDPITADSLVLPHALLLVPNSYQLDVSEYSWDEITEKWSTGVYHFGETWPDMVANFDLLAAGIDETAPVRIDISDATFDANAWAAQGLDTGYRSEALSLIVGTEFAAVDLADPDVLKAEQDVTLTTTAAIWFESDWTPPRYRIVYETADTRPALRLYPRDGDGRGLGGVRRLYPPPRGHRLVGGQP